MIADDVIVFGGDVISAPGARCDASFKSDRFLDLKLIGAVVGLIAVVTI